MSLINQMLKDLENRSKEPVNPDVILSGLSSNPSVMRDAIPKIKYLLISIFFIILLSVFIKKPTVFNFVIHKKSKSAVMQPIVSLKEPTVKQPALMPQTEASLTGIAMQAGTDLTSLRFLFNKNTLYTVDISDTHKQIILTFDHSNLISDIPPLNYLKSAVQTIEMSSTKEGDLQVAITLNDGAQIDHLDWVSENGSPELQLDLYYHVPFFNEAKPSATPIKHPVLEFNAEQQYRRAMEFLKGGQNEQAIKILLTILDDFPQFYTARQSLVSLLLEKGQIKKATQLLEVGLYQQPNFAPFIQLKARVLVSENKIQEALQLLKSSTQDIKDNPNYFSFMAALYQRIEQHEMAAKLYEQLLQLQPVNASWWAGYAISLESLGKKNEAKEAYLRADKNDGLAPELRAFVETRLNEV